MRSLVTWRKERWNKYWPLGKTMSHKTENEKKEKIDWTKLLDLSDELWRSLFENVWKISYYSASGVHEEAF